MANRLCGTTLLLTLSLCILGCGVHPKQSSDDEPKPITQEERIPWYQACWNDFNQQKWDAFKACYAPNATVRQLGFGSYSQITGPDQIAASAQEFVKSFPDVHGDAQLILINATHIAGIYALTGTNSGPLTLSTGKEVPATKKKFGLLFAHEIEAHLTAPQVMREIGVMDSGTLTTQLGLSKTAKRPVSTTDTAAAKIVMAKNDDAEKAVLEADKNTLTAWNKHDANAYGTLVADDAVFHDMTAPADENKAEAAAMDQAYWTGFSDANITTALVWAAGNYVVTVGNLNGTNDGDFPPMKLKKTGLRVSVPFLEVERYSDGKLAESWLFFDSANFAAQLKPPKE